MRDYKSPVFRCTCVLTLGIAALFNAQVSAQNIPQIILPSPDAVSLFKFQEYPVDYSTGLPNINIDLYNIKVGSINLPISMNYHASGRQVYDQDGPLGLSWNFNCGGMVSRTVYGSEDFGEFPFPSPFKTSDLDNRNYYTYFEQIVHYLNNPTYVNHSNWKDSEYDIFSYYFGEKSGKFIFRDSNGVKVPELLPHEPYKINPIVNQTRLNGFNIIDDKGVTYKFIVTGTYYNNQALVVNNNYQVSQIISPDRVDTIKFTYNGANKKRITINQTITFRDKAEGADIFPTKRTDEEQTKTDYYTTSALASISYRNGDINLTYNNDKIARISINDYKNNTVRSIEFHYSPLDTSPEIFNYTHKLDSIIFKGDNGSVFNKYKFEYYPSQSQINVRYRDWWGYYNNSGVHDIIPQYSIQYVSEANNEPNYQIGNSSANRTPSLAGLLSGTLKKIYYPTGGSAEFIYENNQYYDYADKRSKLGPGLRLYQSKYKDNNGNETMKTFKYGENENGYGTIDLVPDINSMSSEQQYCYLPNHSDPNPYAYSNAITTFRQRTFYSDFLGPLQDLSNRPITYSSVTEYNGTTDDNFGKTVYKYQNYDWAYSSLQTHMPLSIQRRHIYQYNYWEPPELISKSEFENFSYSILPYKLKKKTVYSYLDSVTGYVYGLHVEPVEIFPQRNVVSDPTPPQYWSEPWAAERGSYLISEPYSYDEYRIPLGMHKLSSIGTILYDSDTTQLLTYQDFKYNSRGLISQMIENSSTDKLSTTTYKYPFDYPGDPMLNVMSSDSINMLNYIIEESKSKGNLLISGKKIDYFNWSSQLPHIYPKYIFQKKGAEPYVQELQFNSYDKSGNVTSVLQRTDAPICYIWSYKGQYPVAKIKNIEYSTLLSLLGGSAKIEEFANKTPSATEIAVFLQPVVTYSQNKDILIDSYSYLPFGNLVANSDPHGNTTYYVYDNFQRLKTVKNKDQLPLKNYAYNTNSGDNTGANIFFSNYLSETFSKNNCAVGLYGTFITYRVPAKRYQSSKSQYAADSMAAADIRTFGQNYTNSNGACFYYNSETSQTFTRNNCSPGVNGSSVTYTVPAKRYYSFNSQHDADAKAAADISEMGQNFANSNGTCGFKNAEISMSASRNNCPPNTVSLPTSATYVIYADKYYSPISQAQVDSLVNNDFEANMQNYANTHCDCAQLVKFSFTNTTSDEFGISFSNGTDFQLSVHAAPGPSSVQIPVGTYSISASVIGSGNQHHIYIGSKTAITGNYVTFTGVNVSSSTPGENKMGMY